MKLAIVTTHPIQYYAPVFQLMAAQNPDTKVFYTWGQEALKKFDPGFQKTVEWDIPLLEGYPYTFLRNTSAAPGTETFSGINNPDAIAIINSFNPDVILIYGWSWKSHLQIIRHYSGKKQLWFRGDSTLLDSPNGIKKSLRKLFLRWVYRHINGAFYVGTQNKAYFKKFGLTEAKLKFAPHAIDNNRFSIDRRVEAAELRQSLSIPTGAALILFAGKLEQKKDPFTLLEAFETVEKDNLFLLFAGNGVMEGKLKERAATSPKRAAILFLGFQNQAAMPVLYQAAQLFCLPSVGPGETWGLAVNEAMAAGLPVIVSDKVGCATDLVWEGVNGYVFKHGDKADLADKIKLLLCNPETLEEFGTASKKIIFDWSFKNQAENMLNSLKKCTWQK